MFSLQKYIIKSSHRNIKAGTIENSSSSRETHPSNSPGSHTTSPAQGRAHSSSSRGSLHGHTPTSSRTALGQAGLGQDESPQALGPPSGVSLNPRSSLGSCSQHPPPPKPKGTQFFCGGCHPSNLSEHQSLHPTPTPPLLAACPPTQQQPGPPSPSQAQHPREHRVRCAGAVRPAGQGPLDTPDLLRGRISPHTPGCDTSAYPPSPEPSSAPRMSQGTLGLGTIPVLAPGGAQGSLKWGTPCEGWTCQLLMSCVFSTTSSANSHDHPESPRHANTARSELCLAYLGHIYRQRKTLRKISLGYK